MRTQEMEAYSMALSLGQKYYKNAMNRGESPYPPVLDEILDYTDVAGQVDLGLVQIPTERIVGTKTRARSHALAGNFMPLMPMETEFAAKWMTLFGYHTGAEGIRDPIKCYEYLGRFYVEEGNKRASILKAVNSAAIPGRVIRVVPRYTEAPERRVYYEFMWFYNLTRLYEVEMRRWGDYARLLSALGCPPDREWTPEERKRFSAAFVRFRGVFEAQKYPELDVTPGEGLLVWLQMFSMEQIRAFSQEELEKAMAAVWPDIAMGKLPDTMELIGAPQPQREENRSFLNRLLGLGRTECLKVAFLFDKDPAQSTWAAQHAKGSAYLSERLGNRVEIRSYIARDEDCAAALDQALTEGAQVVFATRTEMIDDCRRAAVLHPEVKYLTCGFSQPYAGVRSYFCRVYETKFLSGAVAGVLCKEPEVGYLAYHPIAGVPAEINAFALGLRMTNPEAKVRVSWACVPGDPMEELRRRDIRIISNRLAPLPDGSWEYVSGTWRWEGEQALPVTDVQWNWGKMYEQILLSIFSGVWSGPSPGKAVNYWWGLDSGAVEFRLSEELPAGVRFLAEQLRSDLVSHSLNPFRCCIRDQNGVLRNDGTKDLGLEELIGMDWFCDNVIGSIPPYTALHPRAQRTARLLGLYRDPLPPETMESSE